MDAINLDVLKQLQEYAKKYFAAIVELNTVNGKCSLAPGKYLAKQLIDNSHKSVFGHYYALPEGEEYDETITVESGTFRASFPHRRIFTILADWETMSRAGMMKSVFEIEGAEEKSAKVLTSRKTILGAYKEKKMTLRRIHGNWWGEVKEIRKNKGYSGYYELNGVMFQGGKMFFGEPEHESTVNFCKNHGDDEMETSIFNYIAQNPGDEFCAYYSEVLTRAGIHIETEETAAIMEAAKEEKRKRGEKKAAVSAKKPIWKQANELAGEYDKRGYQFVYNGRTKLCYLTIPGHIFVDGSQCTTELTYVMTGKIDDFRDIPKAVGEYNAMYCAKYAERCPQMLAYLPTEPREAGIGRELQGQEAKCRLAPSWVANRVLPHGFRVLCFSSYPNGDFSISVENKEGCRILTKDEFRKLCSEPPQSPTTSTDIQTIKPQEKRAQTARKEPKRTIKIFLQVQRPAYHFREVTKMVVPRPVTYVPRECSTADAAYWLPRPNSLLVASNEFQNIFSNLADKKIMAINIYCRVSTLEQNYDQQMQDIKAYFAAHSLKMADVENIVDEHESGGKSYTDRKFQQLLNKCKPGDYIYAASTDRLGRNFIDMMRLMEDAKKRGVIIVACKQNLSLDDDNSMAKIVLAVTAIMDEDERKRIKHRTANKKAWQREQIEKHGYFIIENGPNAGERCNYVGSPKFDDMSEAQRSAILAAREASAAARTDAAISWRDSSQAVKFVRRKKAEGWGVVQITEELGKLYDEFSSTDSGANPYATPTGYKPSKGTVSKWCREMNPIAV